MTAVELISAYRQATDLDTQGRLTKYFAFKPALQADGYSIDTSIELRTAVVVALLTDFSIADIKFIRMLFHEEMECELATGQHDNLYQLCFYLYSLGQFEDTFILYDAKFSAQNMDVGCMLDREAITMGHEVEVMIDYVESEFGKHPELKKKYPTIIEELKRLLEYPDYKTIQDYSKFIKGYFFGHENV